MLIPNLEVIFENHLIYLTKCKFKVSQFKYTRVIRPWIDTHFNYKIC